MPTALKMTVPVLPGRRIEVVAPELPEGGTVELIIVLPEDREAETQSGAPSQMSMLEFLKTLPQSPSPRAFPTWEEYEQFLQDEKNAWDR